MNEWGRSGIPFFFLIDFPVKRVHVYSLDQIPNGISFDIANRWVNPILANNPHLQIEAGTISFNDYQKGFELIQKGIKRGDSYLCNYTASVPLQSDATLSEIYATAAAPFKLKFFNEFVCFSPERFVQIEKGLVRTYPMKGTAVYEDEHSLQKLMDNEKEKAEHYTVVDLLRNDLGRISDEVEVKRFRYPSYIHTAGKKLIQLSSEIEGRISASYQNQYGDIFESLLPAGSISGAPKKRTCELIEAGEQHQRGYYTGVFGIFDGEILESAVAIRFIEHAQGELRYKTGGGITHRSDAHSEFQELLNKVYVPLY